MTSTEVDGDHFEPSGIVITVSDITISYVMLIVTEPTLLDAATPVKL